jgi:flagellin
LRINSAADDAAGLAIREMMRADIATMNQGIRNTADAISMLQTADGAQGVIDEQHIRMKELAEQAATGTYTTAQREIINSEYQAMAAEIDRIANATNFNGIKLLDGSVTNQHGGQGLKIHFGVSNDASEDYYFVNIGDARATSSTGLRIAGDAKNDIWGQGAAGSGPLAGPGCCTAGYATLDGTAGFVSGQTISYGYNWDWMEDSDSALLTGKYLAGRYTVTSSDSLQNLINKVNAGTQSRVGVNMSATALRTQINAGGSLAVCVGDEAYLFGSAGAAGGQPVTTTVPEHEVFTTEWSYKKSAHSILKDGNVMLLISGSVASGAGLDISFFTAASARGTTTASTSALAEADALNQAQKYEDSLHLYSSVSVTAGVTGANRTLSSSALVDGLHNASKWTNYSAGVTPTFLWNSLVLAEGQSVRIHTGIYADNKGNWTDNSAVGKALHFDELTFTFQRNVGNPNYNLIDNNGFGLATSNVAVGQGLSALLTEVGGSIEAALTAGQAINASTTEGRIVLGQTTPATLTATTPGYTKTTTSEVIPEKTTTTQEPGFIDSSKKVVQVANNNSDVSYFTASALASAINHNSNSQFWAMVQRTNSNGQSADMVYIFTKEGGNYNDLLACDVADSDTNSRAALSAVSFENVLKGDMHQAGTTFTLGGEHWGTMKPIQTKSELGNQVWNVTLNGRDVGKERDLWIANEGEIHTPGLTDGIINGMDRNSFVEIQNAADGPWKGAEVRTQSSAQEALDAITESINTKDKIRADLGALQNRLENTMTNLTVQAENLQASESRISDVDVATEMTEFTRNNVLSQAATSMLAQANSLSQLALSLLR